MAEVASKARPTRPLAQQDASRQVTFHTLLVGARKKWLLDALRETLPQVDPAVVKHQILQYAPTDALKILAGTGIRDEEVFPTPVVLEAMPSLVGYYRLLLGVPRKTFYRGPTGMGQLSSLEKDNTVNDRQMLLLDSFCRVMGEALGDLIRRASPTITQRDVEELPLLTLGSYFQGGNNNLIGKEVTAGVFQAITDAVEPSITKRDAKRLTVSNDTGEVFIIVQASDPDLTIERQDGKLRIKLVATEIKGGTDDSNAHNRAGEAEKSHLKAKAAGFRDFWTLFQLKGLDLVKLKSESPTTTRWFDVAQIVAQEGPDWDRFVQTVKTVLGMP